MRCCSGSLNCSDGPAHPGRSNTNSKTAAHRFLLPRDAYTYLNVKKRGVREAVYAFERLELNSNFGPNLARMARRHPMRNVLTMITTDQISAFGPRFKLSFEALSAIRAQCGSGPMLQHALATNDAPTRPVALMLEDTKFALALMGDWIERAKRFRVCDEIDT
jgi:hypothetical protein